MSNVIRLSLATLCALTLAACGGGAKLKPGKENAAAAAFQASQGAGSAEGNLFEIARQNAGQQIDVTVSCPKGGKAQIHYTAQSGGQSGSLTFDLKYEGCSYNGKTSMTGNLAVAMSISAGSGSVSLALKLTGRVDFSGEISDFVDVNVTQTLDSTRMKAGEGASVTLVLNGTIKTSSATYTYNNETVTVTAGRMEAEGSTKS